MRATHPGTDRTHDDRFRALKKRIALLARFDGEVLRLEEGLFLARPLAVKDSRKLVAHLRAHGALGTANLETWVRLESPPAPIDATLIATAHRDLRALAEKSALTLAREHKKALVRYGKIDEAWLAAKRQRIERANAALRAPQETDWFAHAAMLLHALRGQEEAARLAEAGVRLRARPAERRKEARAQVDAVVHALESGAAHPHADRLDAARDLPGRARRRRVIEVLREIVGWKTAPPELAANVAQQGDYPMLVREAGHAMAAALPIVRDPGQRESALQLVAELALIFPIGDRGLTLPAEGEEVERLKKYPDVADLAFAKGLVLSQALVLANLPVKRQARQRLARWVTEGLDLGLVVEVAENKLADNLVRVPDVRAARAYATWATRLAGHYKAQGIEFSLSPELFANLPRNEDLAVLAMCLMEHLGEPESTKSDPIAVLDSTLALFDRLPAKAQRILGNLRANVRGEGRRLAPELAAWLDDDEVLDRYLHVAKLAGQSPLLSAAIREDFEHAKRTRREREHLATLPTRSVPQQGRLDALLRSERTLEGSSNRRTRRRIAERTERLLPLAYRRELDSTFRQILHEAWGIEVQSLTPAWRDAVRFWLAIDDNRDLLGRLLKEVGHDFSKLSFERNRTWIATAQEKIAIDAWLAPREREIVVPRDDGKKSHFVLKLEEDPLEVLRMGIPFATCLALDTGCNAAATVMNAIDANKRVIYVRSSSGSIVARKLLTISKEYRILGYNLYCSVSGAEEEAIRSAVLELCETLARETGAALAATGDPEKIHEGFWYDDGTTPFEEDRDVAAYLRALELPPAPKWFEDLGREASAWCAADRGDVAAATLAYSAWNNGPANMALGDWIVERIGVRATEKLADEDSSMLVAAMRALASEGQAGLVRAFAVAGRASETRTHHRIVSLIARFPPSAKIAVAFTDLALLMLKRNSQANEHSIAHLSLLELPRMFDDVTGALDLLDAIAPVWDHVAKTPSCKPCRELAIETSAEVLEAVFARVPDPDVVVAALMNRRRSIAVHIAALRIAARHVLPGGARALVRFGALRPELASSPEGVAAFVRQAATDVLTPGLAARAPKGTLPPFEALRDLVLSTRGLELLARTKVADIHQWKPGPWELAWRRRLRDESLHDELLSIALRVTAVPGRHLELLALLGDLPRLERWSRASAPKSTRRSHFITTSDERHHLLIECKRTAISVAAQALATELHPDITTLPVADAGYVHLAVRALEAETLRPLARQKLISATVLPGVVDWQRLLAAACAAEDVSTVTAILDARGSTDWRLPVRHTVDIWQLPEARDALLRVLVKRSFEDWTARVWAAEREAHARGLDVFQLLERLALTYASLNNIDAVVEAHTVDQLRSVAAALAKDAAPAEVAAAINEATDVLSTAIFIRAMQRQPIDRQTAIREALLKVNADTARGAALERWATVKRSVSPRSLRDARPSIIERE